MKIIRIAQNPQSAQMTKEQQDSQKIIQESMSEIQQAVGLINKSMNTLQATQTEKLFQKDGLINALQNGDIRRLDQNKVNQSLQAMGDISQGSLAINNALMTIENEGGDIKGVMGMAIQSLQTGNFSAFVSTMGNFQNSLSGMTGTNSVATQSAY